jgi:PTH1 family peptidyl-tRNA hydrolase
MSNLRPPKLIVGLGNPGAEYAATRHNAGFWLVDQLARDLKISLVHQAKFHGTLGRAQVHGNDLWLLQPSTFMNRSGQSVVAVARFYKILPDEILVAHDELDLAPGGIRLKQGGGAGGHNGIKDIQAHLTTPDFWRLRLGVGHPRTLGLQQEVADFVLHRPRANEQEEIDRAIERCLVAWPKLALGDYAAAQQQLHGKA